MRRFHFPKGLAIPLTVAFVVAIYPVISVALVEASFQLREKIPLYVEHLRTLHERLAVFLGTHGIHSAQLNCVNRGLVMPMARQLRTRFTRT
jgi:hypothetical protein